MGSFRENPVYQALAAVCDDMGFEHDVQMGGKHPKLEVLIGDKLVYYTFSGSPSDHRAPKKATSDLRRIIAEAQAEPVPAPVAVDAVAAVSSVRRIEYRGQPVVTFAMIDDLHGRPEGTARRQFNAHRARHAEGVDFFKARADEIRSHKIIDISPRAHEDITFVTRRGYLKLVKGFNDDRAWEVMEEMVDRYFVVEQIKQATASGDIEGVVSILGDIVRDLGTGHADTRLAIVESESRMLETVQRLTAAPPAKTDFGGVFGWLKKNLVDPFNVLRHEAAVRHRWFVERFEAMYARDRDAIARLKEMGQKLEGAHGARLAADAVTLVSIYDMVGVPASQRTPRASQRLSIDARNWFSDRGYLVRRHEPRKGSPLIFQRDRVREWWAESGQALLTSMQPSADVVPFPTAVQTTPNQG